MTNLFKKAAVIGDIHFGKRSDSEQYNQDCIEYIEWVIEQIKHNECDCIIFMGDSFENGKTMSTLTLHYALKGIRMLGDLGIPIYWCIGNHDLYYKENRRVHALPWLELIPNVQVINEVSLIGNCILAPWVIGEEVVLLTEQRAKYVFAHLELPLFIYDNGMEIPDHGKLHGDHFYQCEHVFSGHIHLHQQKINANGIPITYIGNCFPQNYNDVNDRRRGCMILEWDKEPVFLDWTDGPNYNRIKLSDLLEIIQNDQMGIAYNSKSFIEVYDDLNMGIEDTLMIKEALQDSIRGITFIHDENDVDIEEVVATSSDKETVDEFIRRGLTKLDTSGGKYETNLLLSIYEGAQK